MGRLELQKYIFFMRQHIQHINIVTDGVFKCIHFGECFKKAQFSLTTNAVSVWTESVHTA